MHSAAQMQDFGERVATVVRGSDVVILTGELGSGKTTFAQGVARGLGITGPVTSPTFVLAKNYRGSPLGLLHLDVYRISAATELLDLWSESDAQQALTLVEWGTPWWDEFGTSVAELTFAASIHTDDNCREINVREINARAHARENDLAERIMSVM